MPYRPCLQKPYSRPSYVLTEAWKGTEAVKRIKGKDLKRKTIEEWFKKLQATDFDLKTEYVARYKAVADFLRTDVHPLVELGAAVKDGIFLNNHGPEHVATVIRKSSELLANDSADLSAYEVYMLLTAIQLHDIGNILGRAGHEARINELNGRLEAMLGDDTPEKRLLKAIAQAHGGNVQGDKDTIRH